jgi:hypothetical protein
LVPDGIYATSSKASASGTRTCRPLLSTNSWQFALIEATRMCTGVWGGFTMQRKGKTKPGPSSISPAACRKPPTKRSSRSSTQARERPSRRPPNDRRNRIRRLTSALKWGVRADAGFSASWLLWPGGLGSRRGHDARTFPHRIEAVRNQIGQCFHLPIRPQDIGLIHP